jgi:molecular chaperone GrpE (heat shock protein)
MSLTSDVSPSSPRPAESLAAVDSARLAEEVTRLGERVAALETVTARVSRALDGHTVDAEARRELLQRIWLAAPLVVRLEFAAGVLEPTHGCQAVLQEASELVELCHKGDLDAWLTNYPSLFADAVARLCVSPSEGTGDAGRLVREVLGETRELLDRHLQALGVEWIGPEPGAEIADEHEVAGDESVPGVTAGRVARVQRPGLRRRGRVVLPAQVVRAMDGGPVVRRPDPSLPATVPVTPPLPHAEPPRTDAWPEWLRSLQRRSLNCTAATEIIDALSGLGADVSMEGGAALSDDELRRRLVPLVPLLGPHAHAVPGLTPEWLEAFQASRPELLTWLSAVDVEVIWPAERAAFDPATMETAGERRTAHPHESGTVARVEQVGLKREGRVLVPARVVRYVRGAAV